MTLEHKLAQKVLFGCFIIGLIALIAVVFDFVTFSFAVEFSIICAGIITCLACLFFITYEHKKQKAKERLLLTSLMKLIEEQKLSQAKPERIMKKMEAHLHAFDPEKRLTILNRYLNNPLVFQKWLQESSFF